MDAPTFKRAFRGFDPAEVSQALARMREDVAAMRAENTSLRLQLAQYENALRSSHQVEEKLQQLLSDMESTSAALLEQSKISSAALATQAERERTVIKANAREEATIILRDAERRAQRIVEDAQSRRQDVLDELGMLHGRRLSLIARIKSLLASQIGFLEALERDARDPQGQPDAPIRPSGKDGLGADALQDIINTIEAWKGKQT